ncbi:MAG TPA: hypothetical protein VL134_12905 [Leptolyngbya sp.]|jgi:hypothetical protein|nr:hypothetical protein [Leptolyngbya sp.]
MYFSKRFVARSIVIGTFLFIAAPASAQLNDAQVDRVVEALRQASKPEKPNTGLYSDWQVKPENIGRWSKACGGREVSPSEFQANPGTARAIVTCVVRDVLKENAKAIGNSETIAVQRVAAWWMTGDPTKFNASGTAPYVEKALKAYQTASTEKPAQKPTFYDRYMNAGYDAVQRKDQKTAQLYFQRALDERPQDRFALQAIRNLEASKRTPGGSTPITEQPKR